MAGLHVVAAAVLATVSAVAFGTATAGAQVSASASGALQTITSLEAQGNNVVVNKIGTGAVDSCSVLSVSGVRKTPRPTVNPLAAVPSFENSSTVYVTLSC